mmetsp:Transcript_25592/g.59981  ORF Transcript_25592/g.59981 Transcript_25592/m.59981 type:complete len:399 (-) Transcript_25592:290-1486(-)
MDSNGRKPSSRREEKKTCCTWPRIFSFVLLLAVACFLIWFFEPWNNVGKIGGSNGVNVDIDISGGETTGSDGGGGGDSVQPPPPTTTEPAGYEFTQCDTPGRCCNGLDGACDLRADEILYATLHNGMATLEGGFLLGPNHQKPLEGALEAGYRGINLDICNCGGQLIFCHGICGFGPRDILDVMRNVNEFLDRNPTETIVFIYQVDNDADQKVDLNAFYDRLLLVDGLIEKLYVHDGPQKSWPTLRQLTSPTFNKRIIMFHYNGPDCNIDPGACPDGLHLYYTYAMDNNWDHSGIDSIEDRSSSCELRKNGINRKQFVGLNNFVSPPSRSKAKQLNEYSSALDYVQDCTRQLGVDINFLLVDYWSEGDLPRVTQDHNAALVQRKAGQRERARTLRREQ